MEKLDDIDKEEGERCTFMDCECDPHMSALVLVSMSPHARLKFCQCCLMGKLIRELSLIGARQQ